MEQSLKFIDKRMTLKKLAMLFLAFLPILNLYVVEIGLRLSYPQLTILFFTIVALIKKIDFFKSYSSLFYIVWGVVALNTFYFDPKISSLIPGGIGFFFWALGVGVFSSLFEYESLRKYLNILFVVCAILFLYQFISYYLFGSIKVVLLPLSEKTTYSELSIKQLIDIQEQEVYKEYNVRFCSLFAEPSYFGQFISIALIVELFSIVNATKLFSPISLVMTLVQLMLLSGVGVLSTILIWILKFIQLLLITKNKKPLFLLFLLSPILVYGMIWYLNSSAGIHLMSRYDSFSDISQSESSGFLRLYYGWIYYMKFDLVDKFWGVGISAVSKIFEDGFASCASTIISTYGIIGMGCFLLYYYSLCNRKLFATIAIVLLFVFISFFEAIYLHPIMLICTVVPIGLINQMKHMRL